MTTKIDEKEKGKSKDKVKPKYDAKKPTAYQKYMLAKNSDSGKKKYFDFYNDVKHSSHQIYDW